MWGALRLSGMTHMLAACCETAFDTPVFTKYIIRQPRQVGEPFSCKRKFNLALCWWPTSVPRRVGRPDAEGFARVGPRRG